MSQSQSIHKGKSRYFRMFYGEEFSTLLKKYGDDLTKLNAAVKEKLSRLESIEIPKEENSVNMKDVYVGEKVNDDISQFCLKNNVTKVKIAELIKRELLQEVQ